MKFLISLIFLGICSISAAGPGHGHEHKHSKPHSHQYKKMNQTKLNFISKRQIRKLIKQKKIDASWAKANIDTVEKKLFGKKHEWVVTYLNSAGVKGQKLYIFLELDGKFIATNFTGK